MQGLLPMVIIGALVVNGIGFLIFGMSLKGEKPKSPKKPNRRLQPRKEEVDSIKMETPEVYEPIIEDETPEHRYGFYNDNNLKKTEDENETNENATNDYGFEYDSTLKKIDDIDENTDENVAVEYGFEYDATLKKLDDNVEETTPQKTYEENYVNQKIEEMKDEIKKIEERKIITEEDNKEEERKINKEEMAKKQREFISSISKEEETETKVPTYEDHSSGASLKLKKEDFYMDNEEELKKRKESLQKKMSSKKRELFSNINLLEEPTNDPFEKEEEEEVFVVKEYEPLKYNHDFIATEEEKPKKQAKNEKEEFDERLNYLMGKIQKPNEKGNLDDLDEEFE